MLGSHAAQHSFIVAHASEVSAARRHGVQLAETLGFNETESGKLAIIITELATNVLKHAGEGHIFITHVKHGPRDCIEVLALDKGKGISNLAQSLQDGISTAGTSGNGLGAVKRLAQEFDAYSVAGKGAAVFASLSSESAAHDSYGGAEFKARVRYGTICVPMSGELECGDAWGVAASGGKVTFLVADGLGHGPEAAVASSTAVRVLKQRPEAAPAALMEAMHQALRITRGAAAAVGKLHAESRELCFAGIGNISACIIDSEHRKQLVSHNGIVGNNMRKVQEFSVPWPDGALFIMCSDGIGTQWDLSAYPGLIACHPSLIAGIIYRDYTRGRDDSVVLVAKQIN